MREEELIDRKNSLDEDLKACIDLVSQGSINAISGLSQLIDRDIKVTSIDSRQVPANSTPDIIGGWESMGGCL